MQPQSKCQADEWIEQAADEDLRRFFQWLSIKLIGATINDIAANDIERRVFGWRWLLLDDDFTAACIFANLKPHCTRSKMADRAIVLRERRNRSRQ